MRSIALSALVAQVLACGGGLCDAVGDPEDAQEILRWSVTYPDGTTQTGCALSRWFQMLSVMNDIHANLIHVRAAAGTEVLVTVNERDISKQSNHCIGRSIPGPTDDAGWCGPEATNDDQHVGTYECARAATADEPATVLSVTPIGPDTAYPSHGWELRIRVLRPGILHLTYDKTCATFWTGKLPVWGAVTIEAP